jgi:hypothetical protein
MHHFAKTAAAGVVLLISAGCHGDGLGEHGCPLDYSRGWGSYGLSVEHEEPARCPVFIPAAGTILKTGATIVDGGMPDFKQSLLLIQDARGNGIAAKRTDFKYDRYDRWASESYVYYPAGQANLGPDHAHLHLTFQSGADGPAAYMAISYTNALVASISGTTVIQPDEPQIHTWSAKITQGVPPYQYRWYRDWELVSTSSSYSDIGADSMLLRLDVIDARGEVDSYSKVVVVNTCGGEYLC